MSPAPLPGLSFLLQLFLFPQNGLASLRVRAGWHLILIEGPSCSSRRLIANQCGHASRKHTPPMTTQFCFPHMSNYKMQACVCIKTCAEMFPSSFVCNCHKLSTTQMSTNWRMDKSSMLYLNSGILLNHKRSKPQTRATAQGPTSVPPRERRLAQTSVRSSMLFT